MSSGVAALVPPRLLPEVAGSRGDLAAPDALVLNVPADGLTGQPGELHKLDLLVDLARLIEGRGEAAQPPLVCIGLRLGNGLRQFGHLRLRVHWVIVPHGCGLGHHSITAKQYGLLDYAYSMWHGRCCRAWFGRARQGGTGHGCAWRGLAWPGKARRGIYQRERHTPRFESAARARGRVRQGQARRGAAEQVVAVRGGAWRGMAVRGRAWQGVYRVDGILPGSGPGRPRRAPLDRARYGAARQCTARRCWAGHGLEVTRRTNGIQPRFGSGPSALGWSCRGDAAQGGPGQGEEPKEMTGWQALRFEHSAVTQG